MTIGEALLAPTRIYVKPLLALMRELRIKGMAHITGGGLSRTSRACFRAHVQARLDADSWPRPAIFDWLQQQGRVADAEMHRVFNCGIGMAVIVAAGDADRAQAFLERAGERVFRIGEIATSKPRRRTRSLVCIVRADAPHGAEAHHRADLRPRQQPRRARRRFARSRFRRRRDARREQRSDARGPRRSPTTHAIATDRRRSSRLREPRERSTRRLSAAIDACEPDLVVLAGFMRVLSDALRRSAMRAACSTSIRRCCRRIPACRRIAARSPTARASTAAPCISSRPRSMPARSSRRRRSPCSPDDDEATLAARVLAEEHRLLPAAANWFCAGRLSLDQGRVRLDGELVTDGGLLARRSWRNMTPMDATARASILGAWPRPALVASAPGAAAGAGRSRSACISRCRSSRTSFPRRPTRFR